MTPNSDRSPQDTHHSGNFIEKLRDVPSTVYHWIDQVTKPIRPAHENEEEKVGEEAALNERPARRSSMAGTSGHTRSFSLPHGAVLVPLSTLEVFKEPDEIRVHEALSGSIRPEDRVMDLRALGLIQVSMPSRWRLMSEWHLIYSTRKNGYSLATLYQAVRNLDLPLVLAIKDTGGSIFGVWTTETFKPRVGHYGTGECYLWRLQRLERRMVFFR